MSNFAFLNDKNFQSWVMGNNDRIQMISDNLNKIKQSNCLDMIVLTNGIAEHALYMLKCHNLENYFSIVADTRGTIISDVGTIVEKKIHTDRKVYDKQYFIDKYIRNTSSELWNTIKSNRDKFHMLYIDDNPEINHNIDIDVIPLPSEWKGITSQQFQIISDKMNNIKDKNIIAIWDFDCTLTENHMFKAMWQINSQWHKEWIQYKMNNIDKIRNNKYIFNR